MRDLPAHARMFCLVLNGEDIVGCVQWWDMAMPLYRFPPLWSLVSVDILPRATVSAGQLVGSDSDYRTVLFMELLDAPDGSASSVAADQWDARGRP